MVKLPSPSKVVSNKQQAVSNGSDSSMVNSGAVPPTPPVSPTKTAFGAGIGLKEREFLAQQEEAALEEVRKELELAPEVKEAGVEVKKEEIELPPPLPKMGVTQVGPETPTQTPAVSLPLADDKIVSSQGFSIWASITWLAQWCLRQLKKVHIKLKKVGGQIVRIVTK